MTETLQGSCLKAGQHFIFAIINLLLTVKRKIFDSVSKILFIFFFIANNDNYDSNIKNILLHNEYKIINLRYPTYMYQFIIFLIITKIECWPVFKQDPPSLLHTNLQMPNPRHRLQLLFAGCVQQAVVTPLLLLLAWTLTSVSPL